MIDVLLKHSLIHDFVPELLFVHKISLTYEILFWVLMYGAVISLRLDISHYINLISATCPCPQLGQPSGVFIVGLIDLNVRVTRPRHPRRSGISLGKPRLDGQLRRMANHDSNHGHPTEAAGMVKELD